MIISVIILNMLEILDFGYALDFSDLLYALKVPVSLTFKNAPIEKGINKLIIICMSYF